MKQQGNIVIILIIVAALTVGGLMYFNLPKTPPNTQQSEKVSTASAEQTKTFQSTNLKFSIVLPNNFTTEDEPSRITIDSTDGQIYVNRNGTQYNNLNDYLNEFDQKTSLQTIKDENLTINGLQARERVFKNTDVTQAQEKIYFIYQENFVYKLSTSSEALYDDLDQIAQSFRYTP